jgi:DNA-binding transcriptional regulator YhcF (GntR family)
VDVSRPGYRQVAAGLRDDILSGRLTGTLRPQATLAAKHGVSVAIINAAVAELAREGLVNLEHGKPTTVASRRRWRVNAQAEADPSTAAEELAKADARLEAAQHPAASAPGVTRNGAVLILSVLVESAHVDGALVVALAIAHRAFGALPVISVTARPA